MNQNNHQPKKCFCARCFLPVKNEDKVSIEGQNYHRLCSLCYYCRAVPKNNLKIYYGQVFCEECFKRHVLNQNKFGPSDFFKTCFDQWQNNPKFAENMREFMSGSDCNAPYVFMMHPFCRCGGRAQEWFQDTEPKESASPSIASVEELSIAACDLSFENRTEISDVVESCNDSAVIPNSTVTTEEKIENLTKYLDGSIESGNHSKKWKHFKDDKKSFVKPKEPKLCGWINLQNPKIPRIKSKCPECLWQCGSVYV